ncbi:MAG: hypothetical protein KDD56_08250 [Bdellovibrionales bacterium]|nr:hypothetical protein [Bdellovibrionales bacterium]
MSIDWLYDLERDIDNGKDRYACVGLGRNQWVIKATMEDLEKMAVRVANQRKMGVNIVKLVNKDDALTGDMYLVPTTIGDPGARGEPSIEWSTVETKEAADMMRDVRHGPSPYFGMQVEKSVNPSE